MQYFLLPNNNVGYTDAGGMTHCWQMGGGNSDEIAYQAWVAQGNIAAPYTPSAPTPTPAQQAEAAIASGVTINSTSTPEVNGTYACDAAAVADIGAETLSVIVTQQFTNGATSIQWPLADGTLVTFPSPQVFQAWAVAVSRYVSACKQYASGAQGAALPASTVSIT